MKGWILARNGSLISIPGFSMVVLIPCVLPILRAGVVEDAEVPGSEHQEAAERWIVHLVRCIPILGMPTGDANW